MFRKILFALCLIASAVVLTAANKSDTKGRIVLTAANTLTLRGTVNEDSVSALIKQIELNPGQDFNFYIASPGGDIFEGMQLIQAMKAHTGKITCIADVAISMAFVIFQNCETRLMLEHGVLMQHEAAYGLKGTAPHNLSFVMYLTNVLKKMDAAQAARIGMTYEQFKARTSVDWWLDGDDAMKFGAADGFTLVACSKDLLAKTTFEEVELVFGAKAVFKWNGCPLMHAPEAVSIKMYNGGNPTKEVLDDFSRLMSLKASQFNAEAAISTLDVMFQKLR